jgi:CBS domain-containing protein
MVTSYSSPFRGDVNFAVAPRLIYVKTGEPLKSESIAPSNTIFRSRVMRAKDVMTSPVITVSPDTTIVEAISIMLLRRISGLPVTDQEGRLLGILTEGDFLRRAETGTQRRRSRWLELLVRPGRLADEYTHSHARKVSALMTLDPVTVAEDTPLHEIVELMEKHQIKRVPVVSNGQVVGIVTRANLLHALVGLYRQSEPSIPSDDTAIRSRLLAELAKEKWAPIGLINPIVHGGVVELFGSILDERERKALIVLAENIPGVKAVRDHLAWVEPTSGLVFYGPEEKPVDCKDVSRAAY